MENTSRRYGVAEVICAVRASKPLTAGRKRKIAAGLESRN